MDDYQDGESITINDLASDTDLNSALIDGFDNRTGRSRVDFLEKCDIEKILRFFEKSKKSSQVFVFPYHLKETQQ